MAIEIKLRHPVRTRFCASSTFPRLYGVALPAESNHLVDIGALEKDNVSFFVVRHGGRVVGCGALVEAGDGTAEVKRMFVDPEARVCASASLIMDTLIARGEELGLSAIRLETGISQPEAIGLYRKAGFVEIEAFAPYKPDPLSLFMEKVL